MTVLPSEPPKVVGVHFNLFLKFMEQNWTQGRHLALVGPTGEGKTTLAVALMNLRKWVIALDPKGDDETLAASGFVRISKLPLPRKIRNDVAEGKPVHIIISGDVSNDNALKALRALMAKVIEMVRVQGGWTLFADEFQILSDLRMFNLAVPIERMLIAARSSGVSVLTAFQASAWVSKASTRQAWMAIVFQTRDRAMIKNIAEAMGRDWRTVAAIIDELPEFFAIAIPKNVRSPMMIIHPPKVGK